MNTQQRPRRNRRRAAMKHLKLDAETHEQWRQFGRDQGLESDLETARFLLQSYRKSSTNGSTKLCPVCTTPLTLTCTVCQLSASPRCQNGGETYTKSPSNSSAGQREGFITDNSKHFTVCQSDYFNKCPSAEENVTELFYQRTENSTNCANDRENCKSVHSVNTVTTTKCLATDNDSTRHQHVKEDIAKLQPLNENAKRLQKFLSISRSWTAKKRAVRGQRLEENSAEGTLKITRCYGSSMRTVGPVGKLQMKATFAQAGKATLEAVKNMLSKTKSSTHPGPVKTDLSVAGKKDVFSDREEKVEKSADREIAADLTASVNEECPGQLMDLSAVPSLPDTEKTESAGLGQQAQGNKTYACHVCGVKFALESQLSSHQASQESSKLFLCKECRAAFTLSKSLEEHMATAHSSDKTFKCQTCEMSFTKSNSLTLHMKKYHTDRLLTCDECGVSFSRVCDLKAHFKRHKTVREKTYECPVCGQAYMAAHNLTIHSRAHSGARPYLCQDCGASFLSASNLQGHLLRHTGTKPFSCKHCSRCFTRVYDLKVHTRSHTGEKPFQCALCGKTFSTSSSLARHVHSHNGKKMFTCSQCSATFSYSSTLKIHMRRHTGEMFRCPECGKSFLEKRSLTVHLRTHSGEKPFQCQQCSAAFRSAGSLKQHLPVHTGLNPLSLGGSCGPCLTAWPTGVSGTLNLKPYKCDQCCKAFPLASKLRRHAKRHFTDKPFITKPYSCNQCGSAFSQLLSLSAHMQKHHSVSVVEEALSSAGINIPGAQSTVPAGDNVLSVLDSATQFHHGIVQ